MTTAELRRNGLCIYPIGRKVYFADLRNGYLSQPIPQYAIEEQILNYLNAHRVPQTERNAPVLPL